MSGLVRALMTEIAAIDEDRWLFALVAWLPPVLVLFLVLIFSAGQPSNLPVGVVDLDQSSLSRKLVRYLDASPTLTTTRHYTSIQEGKDDISRGGIYALVVIPAGLSRDDMRADPPAITAFFNAQYLLIAKAIRSALVRVESTLAIELDVGRTLVTTPVIESAMAISMPLRSQISALYNMNMNYATFLVPPLLLAMFQLIIICAMILSLGRKTNAAYPLTPASIAKRLLDQSLVYTCLFTAHILISIMLLYGLMGWPHQSSLFGLLPLIVLFVVACQLVGGFIYALTFNMEKSLSLAGAFSAPAFAFLGVTFPTSAMSAFAQFWHDLMPASHFVVGFLNQVSYSADVAQSIKPVLFMSAFAVLIPAIICRFRIIPATLSESVTTEAIDCRC